MSSEEQAPASRSAPGGPRCGSYVGVPNVGKAAAAAPLSPGGGGHWEDRDMASPPVFGDLHGIANRVRDIDEGLEITYQGNGYWQIWCRGRLGRRYQVFAIGPGCGNRWPKDTSEPEIDKLDVRVLYLLRDADMDQQGGSTQALQKLEHREAVGKQAGRKQLESDVDSIARDAHKLVVRDIEGRTHAYYPAGSPAGEPLGTGGSVVGVAHQSGWEAES